MSRDSVGLRKPSYFSRLSRHSRLADVERGKALTRTLDMLAQEQWRSPGGVRASLNPPGDGDGSPLQQHPKAMFWEWFSPWGSRSWDLDQQVSRPDSLPRVILPRRSIVMSRVPSDFRNRQNKTRTNFYSRNGTVTIIEPFTPFPREEDSKLNSTSVEREDTYVMLQRIDQIIHPAKEFFKSDLNSSEVENVSVDSSGLLVSVKPSTDRHQSVHNRDRTCTRVDTGSERGSPLALVVSRLARSPLDAYEKCRVWVQNCPSLEWL